MIEDLFKTLVWDAFAKAAIKRGLSMLPAWLGGGPLGAILIWVALMVADWLYAGADEFFDLKVIVFKKEGHKRAFDRASLELKLVSKSKGAESPEFKEARERHKTDLSKFARFNVA